MKFEIGDRVLVDEKRSGIVTGVFLEYNIPIRVLHYDGFETYYHKDSLSQDPSEFKSKYCLDACEYFVSNSGITLVDHDCDYWELKNEH